jgi:hypothetical protein
MAPFRAIEDLYDVVWSSYIRAGPAGRGRQFTSASLAHVSGRHRRAWGRSNLRLAGSARRVVAGEPAPSRAKGTSIAEKPVLDGTSLMLHGVRHRRELVEPEAVGLAGCQDRLANPRVDSVVRSLHASRQAPKTNPKPSAATTHPRCSLHPRRTQSHHWSDGQGDESAP